MTAKNERWEYKVADLASQYAAEQLNNYGAAGWELVAIGGRYGERAYLKRRMSLVHEAGTN